MKRTPYTCPPAAAIAAALNIPVNTARTVRGLARGEIRVTGNPAFPRTNAWLNRCLHPPLRIELIMSAMDETAGTHGVVPLWSEDDMFWPVAEYLNTGDTYSTTLLFRHDTGTFRITTWGDFVEKNEKRLRLK